MERDFPSSTSSPGLVANSSLNYTTLIIYDTHEVEDGSDGPPDGVHFLGREVEGLEGGGDHAVVLAVGDLVHAGCTALSYVVVQVWVPLYVQFRQLCIGEPVKQLNK